MSKINLGTLLDWQHEYIHTPKFLKVLCGASNTGKSHIARIDDLLYCIQNPGAHVCLTAETYTQAVRAMIEPMQTQMQEWGIQDFAEWKKQEGIYQFKNGSRMEVYSSEKIANRIRSREFSRLRIEEATTLPDKHIEDILYSAIRYLRQPGFKTNLCLTLNPDLKTRYLYKYLYEEPPDDMFKKDMTFCEGYNRHDTEYEAKLKMGSQRQQDLYLWGKWGNLEGQMFVLDEPTHIRPIDIKAEGIEKFFITFDYGFDSNDAGLPKMIYLLFGVIYTWLDGQADL